MLSLKLVRSLVLGGTINTTNTFLSNQTHPHNHNHNSGSTGTNDDDDDDDEENGDFNHTHHPRTRKARRKTKTRTTPVLIFLPTNEIIKDTYRICTIARDMGMNLHPNPSLSHIIFSWPSPSSSPTTTTPSSSSCSSSTWSLHDNFVPLPFPYLTYASITHLQSFVTLSRGLFKLGFCKLKRNHCDITNNWDCCSLSLFCRVTCEKIESMDGFCRVLVGMGWSMFKIKKNPCLASGKFGSSNPVEVYLFRKVESSRGELVEVDGDDRQFGNGRFRVRELRLPTLDFGNAPLRILQYILLMTDGIFYLA